MMTSKSIFSGNRLCNFTKIVFSSTLLFVIFFNGMADAALLGQFDLSYPYSTQGIASGVDVDIYYLNQNGTTLFDDLVLSGTDQGVEFLATSSQGSNPDPNFDNFIFLLADSVDQNFAIYCDLKDTNGWLEASLLESTGFKTTPDFYDYTIDAIGLKINSLIIDIPGQDPNGDGNWTDFEIDLTLNVYGSPVPIPPALWLLGSGLVGLVGIRKKFKK
jgi:hypothetical protein